MRRFINFFSPNFWYAIAVLCILIALCSCSALPPERLEEIQDERRAHEMWEEECEGRGGRAMCNHRFEEHRCISKRDFDREIERILE